MKIWRNANYTKRNYDCTNIVACTTDDGEFPKVAGKWELDNMFDLSNLTHLYSIANSNLYGYL